MHFLHSRKGRSDCMERIAIAMQDGGAGAGAQHGGAGREANLIFVLPPSVYVGPPVGGTFWFQIFIQAPSLEIWRKTIFGGEGGCWRGSGLACFWATSLEEIFGGVTALISFRLQWDGCSSLPCRGVLSFLSEAREASGSETPRVHNVARWHGRRLAARSARAATAEACGRIP